MSARPRSADSKAARLRAFMANGAWYAASALAEVGGTRFAARLFEIRRGADGGQPVEYECRAVGGSDTAFEYRLVHDAPPPDVTKRKRSASALIKAQAEEIARLQAELAKALASRVKDVRAHQAQHSLFGGSPP